MNEFIWMRPPHGQGEPERVEAKSEVLVPSYSAPLIIPSAASGLWSVGAGT